MDSRRASLISAVKDLLPHLGSGFIEACLDAFGDDVERVVHHVLEGNLPDSLKNLDQSFEGRPAPSPKQEENAKEKSVERGNGKGKGKEREDSSNNNREREVAAKDLLASRSNVYDGDEFDAFSHNIDLSRVQMGKK